MKPWNQPLLARPSTDPILVIEPASPFQHTLAREVESLPAPIARAESIAEASENTQGGMTAHDRASSRKRNPAQ
ncbi:MAG: hypothetical protein GY910_18100 [bacterium]|nr:hypothetical protein [Deltaproteobacteria bacterium]MCP4906889.1 hypothetical protein [bacterium]